jgi:hypothetical protein
MTNRQRIERFLQRGLAAQKAVDEAIAASLVIKPGEWIEIGHVAVRATSLLTASRIAAQVKTTRQVGTIDGVEFMDLGIFRNVLESQHAAAELLRKQMLAEQRAGR